jgi:hypothetical protein
LQQGRKQDMALPHLLISKVLEIHREEIPISVGRIPTMNYYTYLFPQIKRKNIFYKNFFIQQVFPGRQNDMFNAILPLAESLCRSFIQILTEYNYKKYSYSLPQ